MSQSDLHYAVMGCLVEDEDGKVYGVTCEHVTRAADGIFHVENEFGKLTQVGRVLRFYKEKHFKHDIDLIELNEALQAICHATYRNTEGKPCSCRIYEGTTRNLYGRQVFHCFVESQSSEKKALTGKVCGADTHKDHSDLINFSHNFIVDGIVSPFAKEGDSGRIVGTISDDGTLELVGIIVAGRFSLRNGDISQNCSLCLLLNSGLKLLNKYYKKTLRLCNKSSSDKIALTNTLKEGSIIWFKTPEQIKVPDFDLCEQLEMLTACFSVKDNQDDVQILVNFENKMSNKVFSREDVSSDNYNFDYSDQNCVFNSMLACQYLYEKRFKKAENHLKTACRMVSSRSRFPVRLLCKVISYATWFFLDMNKLDEMKLLLDAGLEFMEDTGHFVSFPTESVGYQYYDYARYYLRINEVQQAAQMAKRSVEYFMSECRKDEGSPNRLILAVSQFALIKLGCGEEFESSHQIISEEDVNEAGRYLKEVENIADEQPSVQLTDYLIAQCDWHFRKSNLGKAIKAARQCLKIAQANKLEDEIKWSRIRLETLLKMRVNNQNC